MAKKRKKKTKKKKKIKKVKKVGKVKKVNAKTAKKMKQIAIQSAYTLSLTGSIIVLIAGILVSFFRQVIVTVAPLVGTFTTLTALPNLICGILLLAATFTIRINPKSSGIIILLLSIITLIFPPYGFIVGPILSLIGSIVLLFKK